MFDLIVYQFSREKVECFDCSHFLGLYGVEHLPRGRRLRELMGRLSFAVEGYDDDPRELHSIPEVRAFYQRFKEQWPYWAFFCELTTEATRMMALCCMPSLAAARHESSAHVAVTVAPEDVEAFVSRGIAAMQPICERAEMFPDRVVAREIEVRRYFHL